jgi:hypothetical protein
VASCHEQLQQYEQAEAWRRKWLPVLKENVGPESFRYASFWGLAGLGSNLIQQQKYADAEPVVRESVDLLQRNFPETWDRFRAQSLLGAVLLGEQKYAEAELHLVEGYQGMNKLAKDSRQKNHNPTDRLNLAEALERLVQLCEATNRPEEAAKWRAELEAQAKAAGKGVPPTPK